MNTALPLREVLTRDLEKLLLLSVFFVALPHAFHLSAPVFGYFAALVGWRYATLERPALRPGKWPLLALTLAGAALVYFQYHRVYGRDGGSALFLVGLGFKLMEMKTRREVYLVIYLAFFVAMTQYLFSQSLPMAGYTLLAVVLAVAVLIGTNGGSSFPLREAFRRSAAMLGQALPIMAVLFMFFPRVQGPLWKLPDDRTAAKTGLSEIVEPGSVSRLGRSAELAFRVDFLGGELPPPTARYWRGPVFWQTDGKRWTLGAELPLAEDRKPIPSGATYRYAVTLEPHRRRWVFALDLPTGFPGDITETAEYLLLARDRIADRRQYTLESRLQFRTGPLSADERRKGLQLPGKQDPRILNLVESWRSGGAEPSAIVERALRHFRDEDFYYTLNPPPLDDHPIEGFLFETRRGFCEHYATAFVYLMRVAGVPARIVTGYQGGVWNPVGKFLEVRQADAHAWAEVWLPEQGWSRVDPTAAVAPGRIELGIDLEAQSADVSFNPAGDGQAGPSEGVRRWLRQSRLVWASIDHAWNLWVLGYDTDSQRRFWSSLGIADWRRLAVWLGGLLVLCGAAAAFLFWPKRKVQADPALVAYRRFLGKLARAGVNKLPGEGPLDFARRAAKELPEAAGDIHRISGTFVGLRYGKAAEAEGLRRLRQLVRAFRARRARE
jgi:transglutaminase-like putative cysteine protease